MTVQLSLRYELNDWRKASATFLPEVTDRGLIASNLLIPYLRGNPQQPSHDKAFKRRLLLVEVKSIQLITSRAEAVHSNPDGAQPLAWSAAVRAALAADWEEQSWKGFCSR